MATSANSLPIVVLPSRAKLVKVALGSLAFVIAGAWFIALWLIGSESAVLGIIGAASVAFFGFCGVYAVRRLMWPTPAVVIDQRGILDNASAVSAGFVAWDEIQELGEYRFNNQVFLGIVPRNLEALVAKQPAWKRHVIHANLALGVPAVNIPQTMLPMPVADLLREVKARFDR